MKSLKDTMAKAMSNMFAPVDNVKYDLASGQTGIVTDGGLVTLGLDGALDQNPMDFFSLELPAFAMLTPAKDIQRGDIIVSGGKAYGFILEPGLKPAQRGRAKVDVATDPEAETVTKGELQTINVQGHVSRFRPKRVTMMGVSDGLLVVRSFNNLFGAPGTNQAAQNPMQAMLPLMLMSKGNGSVSIADKLPLLMMMGGMGGGQNMMSNPLMIMALLGDSGFDGLFK